MELLTPHPARAGAWVLRATLRPRTGASRERPAQFQIGGQITRAMLRDKALGRRATPLSTRGGDAGRGRGPAAAGVTPGPRAPSPALRQDGSVSQERVGEGPVPLGMKEKLA